MEGNFLLAYFASKYPSESLKLFDDNLPSQGMIPVYSYSLTPRGIGESLRKRKKRQYDGDNRWIEP